MRYCEILPDIEAGYWIEEYPDIDPDISFHKGESISAPHEGPLIFKVKGSVNSRPGQYFNGPIPVVGKQFVEALIKAGIDNFQIFPVTLVHCRENMQWSDYYAFNVIGLVDAADMEKSLSNIIMEGGEVPELVDFRKLVVDANKVQGHLMWREMRSPGIIVFDGKIEQFIDEIKPEGGWQIMLKEIEVAE